MGEPKLATALLVIGAAVSELLLLIREGSSSVLDVVKIIKDFVRLPQPRVCRVFLLAFHVFC